MAQMKHRVSITLKLPQLQNLIKRDPQSYKDEFQMQKNHFISELEIFKLRPTKDSDRFTELVTFMSHVSACYKDECVAIPVSIMELLETKGGILHIDVRAKLFQALVILRNKAMIDPLTLIKLSFKLFSINDKTLRVNLVEYIFNDIKAINHIKQNEKTNRSIQAFLFSVIEEDTTITARKTVQILCELYRRKIWTDIRTVNMIGKACLSPSARVTVAAVNFFLGIEEKIHEDEDDEKEKLKAPTMEIDYHTHSKKTKKRQRQTQKQIEALSKLRKLAQNQTSTSLPLFPAIQVLHDPQNLAEKLFKKLRQSGERFEVKLLLMNFVSRLVGCHKLLLLSFYSFLQRYLTSHQQNVTQILAYLIQACHDLVPPEDLLPIVKAIAYNFISERCSNEVIAVGINAVREIMNRVPSLLREDGMGDFIQDLALYGKKTHKSVMIASHGIINLVRELYPALLRKSDRGKHHNPVAVPTEYGQQEVADAVEGVDLLEAYEKGDIAINSDDEVVWNDGDENDEEDDDEDEWEDASDDADTNNNDDAVEEEADDQQDEWVDMPDDDENDIKEGTHASEDGDEDEEIEDEDVWEDVSDDEDEDEDEDEDNDGADEMTEVHDECEDETTLVGDDAPVHVATKNSHAAETLSSIRGRLDARRVLTDADFALINKLRTAHLARTLDPKYRGKNSFQLTHNATALLKRKHALDDDDDDDDNYNHSEYAVNPDTLAPGARSEKTSKIDRITHVLEGRKEKRFEKEKHAGGLTNTEKLRKKNFMMVRKGKREVRGKISKSNSTTRYEKLHKKEQLGRDRRKRRRT